MGWCSLLISFTILGIGGSISQEFQYSLPGFGGSYQIKFGNGGTGGSFNLGGKGGMNGGGQGVSTGGIGGTGGLTGGLGGNGGMHVGTGGNVGSNGGVTGQITGGGSGTITGGGSIITKNQVQGLLDALKTGITEKMNANGQVMLTFQIPTLIDIYELEGLTPPSTLLQDKNDKQYYTVSLDALVKFLQGQYIPSTTSTSALFAALANIPGAVITKGSNGKDYLKINYAAFIQLCKILGISPSILPVGKDAPNADSTYYIPVSALLTFLNGNNSSPSQVLHFLLQFVVSHGNGSPAPSGTVIRFYIKNLPGAKITTNPQGEQIITLSIPALIALYKSVHIPVPQELLAEQNSGKDKSFPLIYLINFLKNNGNVTPSPTQSPVTIRTTKTPATVGTTKSPVTVGTTKSPVTMGTTKSPVTIGTTKSPVTVGTTKSPATKGTTKSPSTISIGGLLNTIKLGGSIPGLTVTPGTNGNQVLDISFSGLLDLFKKLGFPLIGQPQLQINGNNKYQIPVSALVHLLNTHNDLDTPELIAFLKLYAIPTDTTPKPTPKPTDSSILNLLVTLPGAKITKNPKGKSIITIPSSLLIQLYNKYNIPIPQSLKIKAASNLPVTYPVNVLVNLILRYKNSGNNQNPNTITAIRLQTILGSLGAKINQGKNGQSYVRINLPLLLKLFQSLGITVTNVPSNIGNTFYNIPLSLLLKLCNTNTSLDITKLIALFKKREHGIHSHSIESGHGSHSHSVESDFGSHSLLSDSDSILSESTISGSDSVSNGNHIHKKSLYHLLLNFPGVKLTKNSKGQYVVNLSISAFLNLLAKYGYPVSSVSGSVNLNGTLSIPFAVLYKFLISKAALNAEAILNFMLEYGINTGISVDAHGCGILEGTADKLRNLGNGGLDLANRIVTGGLNYIPFVGGLGKKVEDLKTNALKGGLNVAGGQILGGDKCNKKSK